MLAHVPKVVLFDLDDTLVHSTDAYLFALAHVGVSPTDADYMQARKDVKAQLGRSNSQSAHRLLYFKAMMQAKKVAPRALLRMMSHWEKALAARLRQTWSWLGRPKLMRTLRRHCRLGVVTNENLRTQLIKWRAIDPGGDMFDAFVTSEEAGSNKPSQTPFALALKLLDVPAEACVMVGDSFDNDIAPAHRMGMQAILSREFLPTHKDEQTYCGASDVGIDGLSIADLNLLPRALGLGAS